jgi:hypothetical protein
MKTLIALGVLLMTGPSLAAEPPPVSDESLIANMRCPETYTDQKAYILDLAAFLGGATRNHPDWTIDQLSAFREKALKAHNCAAVRGAPSGVGT